MGLFDGFSTSNRQEIRPLVTWKLVTTIFIFSGLFSKFIHTNAVENPDGDNGQQTAPHHLHHVTHIGVSGGGELGDLAISDTSRDGLFASMDNDGNGKVTLEELTQYIEGTGGNSLDEQNEILSAVSSTMSNLDDNHDNVLKIDDFSKYWSSLGSVLSVEEVADWVAHSQLMPEAVVQSFLSNAITGYDFPELLENDGSLLESELGVTRQTTKKRLMRGMKMKLFGMGSPPQLAHPPSVRLSEQTLCYTNIQIEWNSVHLNPEDKHDVYPVHMYRLQRQEQSSATSSGQSLKWITVYEGPETNCFDKVYTPPTRTMEENSSGVNTNQIISVTYRLSSWNVIGRSEYSYLKYDITRPTVNSWTDIYGKDECIDQPYPPSHSAAEFQLLVLQNAELANASPALLSRPNSSPVPTIKLGTDSDSTISPPAPWSISTFFSFLFYALWLICTIFSTGHTWLWTIFSILSLPITIIYLYMRFNPPGVDSSGHWLKPLVTSMCSILIGGCEYLSLKFPSTKEKLQPIVQFLQSVTNRDTQVPLRGNPETSSTLRQQRFLKRMNSGRSVGEDSADSQNSGQEDSATCSDSDKCYLCSKSFKLQVTLSKVRWRVKHHCHVCMNLFCSKCGEVTHKNFQCPVRGTCRCQRCADPSKHRSNNHQTQQQQNPPPSPPSPCTDHDDVSTISAITDIQEENNFNEKKKNKSFVSLKEFGISLGRKFDKEKPKLTRVGSGAPSAAGIPPRPTLNSTNSSKKSMWIPTPSLGRITSSPPAISVDRNSADYLSPPDITTSQSWPLPGYDTQRISDVIEE